MCKIYTIVPTFSTVIQTSNSLNLCVRCTGSKSFCWKCFCVCVIYWPYKSFCLKCFCVWCTGPIKVFVGNVSVCVWCTNTIKVFVGNDSVCVCVMYWHKKVFVGNVSVCDVLAQKSFCWKCFCLWCTGSKKFLLEMFLCVWCIGPIKVFFSKCFSVCVMYWPFKSYCFECFFCVYDVVFN